MKAQKDLPPACHFEASSGGVVVGSVFRIGQRLNEGLSGLKP